MTDFHLRPLSFLEYCRLRGVVAGGRLDALASGKLADAPDANPAQPTALEGELRCYHATGGFMPAINDHARGGVVVAATLPIYTDWLRGDMLRLDWSERYLREILTGIDRRYGRWMGSWCCLRRWSCCGSPQRLACPPDPVLAAGPICHAGVVSPGTHDVRQRALRDW